MNYNSYKFTAMFTVAWYIVLTDKLVSSKYRELRALLQIMPCMFRMLIAWKSDN